MSKRTVPSLLRTRGGFTLIEILAVLAILAMVGQLIVMNLGSLVPSTVLDSEASQLMSKLEFLRSEAQLQGKVYQLELDLDNQMYRIVLPPEERLVSEQTAAEAAALVWTPLDDRVRYLSHSIAGGPTQQSGRVPIVIDAHGFTADQTIVLGMRSDALKDLVWTIQIQGLDRRNVLIRNEHGQAAQINPAQELQF